MRRWSSLRTLTAFGAAVAGATGVEVGQERFAPSLEGLAEPCDLGDRAGRERGQDLLGDLLAFGEVVGLVGRAELLRALPGDVDFVVLLVGFDGRLETGLLLVGEPFGAAAQHVLDPVERIA